MPYLYLAFAIVFEVVGTTALKAAANWKLIPTIIVLVAYVISFGFLSLSLKTLPVGLAYAIWAGVGVALVSIAGVVIYSEKIDLAGVFGIILIVGGVVVLNLWSKMSAH